MKFLFSFLITLLSLSIQAKTKEGCDPIAKRWKSYTVEKSWSKNNITKTGGGSSTNSSSRRRVKVVGCKDDQAGHAIPKVLGGKGGFKNTYPINPNVNNKMGKWEKRVAQWLKSPSKRSPKRVSCNGSKEIDATCAKMEYKVKISSWWKALPLRPKKIELKAKCVKLIDADKTKSNLLKMMKCSKSFSNKLGSGCNKKYWPNAKKWHVDKKKKCDLEKIKKNS